MISPFSRRMISELEVARSRVQKAVSILRREDEQQPKRRRRYRGPGRGWTNREHNLLRRLYPVTSFAELEKTFHRSATAIKGRAGVLGLSRGNRKSWNAYEDALLRQLYPSQPAKELAARFGVQLHQLYRRAWILGLEKSEEYKHALNVEIGRRLNTLGKAHRFKKGQVPLNKGLRRPGWYAGRMRETQFKKGERSGAAQAKWVPVGTVKMNGDGYLRRKIADEPEEIAGKGAQSTNWEFVHIRVWEDAHGPIPEGYRIWWKDGDHTNCSLGNLELLSGKDHMARTTIHNLPQPLKEVVQLKASISRQITMKTRSMEATA